MTSSGMSDDGMKKVGAVGGIVAALGAAAHVGGDLARVGATGARVGEAVVVGAGVSRAAKGATVVAEGGQLARGGANVERAAGAVAGAGEHAVAAGARGVDGALNATPRLRAWQAAGLDVVPVGKGTPSELRLASATEFTPGARQAAHSEIETFGEVGGHVLDVSQVVSDTNDNTAPRTSSPAAPPETSSSATVAANQQGALKISGRAGFLPISPELGSRLTSPSFATVLAPPASPARLYEAISTQGVALSPLTIVGRMNAGGYIAISGIGTRDDEILATCAHVSVSCFVVQCAPSALKSCEADVTQLWYNAVSSISALQRGLPIDTNTTNTRTAKQTIDEMALALARGVRQTPSLRDSTLSHLALDDLGNRYVVRLSPQP